MRITVDRDRCVGAGQCALNAPELFDQSLDDGTVVLLHEIPEPAQEDDARTAVLMCPAQVITTSD